MRPIQANEALEPQSDNRRRSPAKSGTMDSTQASGWSSRMKRDGMEYYSSGSWTRDVPMFSKACGTTKTIRKKCQTRKSKKSTKSTW